VANFRIERASRDKEDAAVSSLARAFHDDPMFNFFIPNLVRQAHGLLAFMGATYYDAKAYNEIWVAYSANDKLAGGAVWLPPGEYPRTPRREAMTYFHALPSFVRVGRRLGASVRLLSALDRVHHSIDQPHWYLALLGVDPAYQRTGAGTALLQPVLERCDTEGLAAYLETQKPENVPWYGRHGFDVMEKLEVPGCPPIWTMLRPPRG
jgi:GNAT superfamily N-acetyltransferase